MASLIKIVFILRSCLSMLLIIIAKEALYFYILDIQHIDQRANIASLATNIRDYRIGEMNEYLTKTSRRYLFLHRRQLFIYIGSVQVPTCYTLLVYNKSKIFPSHQALCACASNCTKRFNGNYFNSLQHASHAPDLAQCLPRFCHQRLTIQSNFFIF